MSRNLIAILTMLLVVSLTAISGRADDSSSIAPTEFESIPAVIWHGSADVLSVAVLQQGEHILAALYDGSVMMLDQTTRQPVRIVKCHDGPVSDLVISNFGDVLVTAGYDGTVKTWRLPSLEPAATMQAIQVELSRLRFLLMLTPLHRVDTTRPCESGVSAKQSSGAR